MNYYQRDFPHPASLVSPCIYTFPHGNNINILAGHQPGNNRYQPNPVFALNENNHCGIKIIFNKKQILF